MITSSAKSESTFDSDKAKTIYRNAVELSKKLDKINKTKRNYRDVFLTESVFLRRKLQDYCEKLFFVYNPYEYGRKAEELLWRKVFYDVIQIVKQNRKHMKPYTDLEAAYRTHLDSAIGYYTYLLFELQNKYDIKVYNSIDLPAIEEPKCHRKPHQLKNNETDNKVISWARLAAHRCLVYLGDIARYQVDFEGDQAALLSHRFYLQAFSAFPENGHPHNQIGTLLDGSRYNIDSVYHYLRCLSSIAPLTSAAEGNLERVFDKNFKRFKELDMSNGRDLGTNAQRCRDARRFTINFIQVMQLLHSKTKGISRNKGEKDLKELNATCQNVLTDFKACMYHGSSHQSREGVLDGLNNDLLFKVSVMCLASVYLLKKQNNSELVPAAVAFSLAFFSFLLQQVIVRLQDALQDLEEPSIFTLSGSTTPAESVLNLESFERREDSEKSTPIQRKRQRRRRRKRSSSSESSNTVSGASDGSDLSEGGQGENELHVSSSQSDTESSFLRNSPSGSESDEDADKLMISQDRSWFNPGLSGSFSSSMNAALSSDLTTVKEENVSEPYMTQLPHFIRQMSENSVLYPGIVDGKKFVKPPPGFEKTAESQHVDEITNKIATFQFDTDTEASAIQTDAETSDARSDDDDDDEEESALEKSKLRLERVLRIIKDEGLLMSIHIYCIWLKENKEVLVHTCSDSSQSLWQRICILLNFIPNQPDLLNEAINHGDRVVKEFDKIINGSQSIPLAENILIRGFAPFQKLEANLKFECKRLSDEEETVLRLCAFHNFAQFVANLKPTAPIKYDGESYCCSTAANDLLKAAEEARRERLMKDMAQLRLKAIDADSKSDISANSANKPLYAVIDGRTLLERQADVEKVWKQPAVMIIVPLAALDLLDEMKMTDKSAQACIRWLEDTVKRKSRKLRIQRSDERTDVGAQKNLKKRDRISWRLTQIIDCARYLSKQLANSVHLILAEKPEAETLRPIAKTMLECLEGENLPVQTMSEFLQSLDIADREDWNGNVDN